jgi:hypothetical protein
VFRLETRFRGEISLPEHRRRLLPRQFIPGSQPAKDKNVRRHQIDTEPLRLVISEALLFPSDFVVSGEQGNHSNAQDERNNQPNAKQSH